MTLETISHYFTPGNVVYSRYWNAYDKVIAFDIDPLHGWRVTVIHCDVNGNALSGAWTRSHCTQPCKGDKIISHA